LQQDNQFRLELEMAEHVMHKVETQHSELQDNHFTWLHTAEEQLLVMVSQVHVDLEQTILLELAQAEGDKDNTITHGVVAVAAAEQAELVESLIFGLQALEDILDIEAEALNHQRVHQVVPQVQQMVTIQETDLKAEKVVQGYMDLLEAAEVREEA
jgi:hypothetical protein